MDCFDILNMYIRLVKDLPLAKYLRKIANWMGGGIAAQYCVSVRDILQQIICSDFSKS